MKLLTKNKFTTTVLLVGTIFTCGAVNAADGTINFTGNITADACTIDVNSVNQTVDLGTVSAKALTNKGEVASAKNFSINMSSCPNTLTNARISFDGPTNPDDINVLALSQGQTASNVGVALYEADDSTQIPIASTSKEITLNTSGPNVLNFIAKYKATAAVVGAGSANSATNFTISYN